MESGKAFFLVILFYLFLEIKKKERPFLKEHGNVEEVGHLWEVGGDGNQRSEKPMCIFLGRHSKEYGTLPPNIKPVQLDT